MTLSFAQYGSEYLSDMDLKDEWYKNGKKKYEFSKLDDGSYRFYEWRLSGSMKIAGQIVKVNSRYYRDGLWKRWYSNGHLRSRINYKYDQIYGKCRYYDRKGTFLFEKDYGSGKHIKPFYETESYILGNINPANHNPEEGNGLL